MIINPYAFGVSYDPDAQAFFTASGLTGATNLTAINNLVVALKGYGIWTKMKAIYPFIGGTASLHKWNLKDPRDLDAAFRLTFNGGFTHSSTGALPNGTNAYANTFLIPTTSLSSSSSHFSIYNRTNSIGAHNEFGTSGVGGAFAGAFRFNDGNAYYDCYNSSTNRIATPNSDSRGFFVANRSSSTSQKLFRNNIQLGSTNTNASGNFSSLINDIYLFSYNPVQNLSNRECAFASLGDGLTDTEAANFYTAVNAYQVALSRNV